MRLLFILSAILFALGLPAQAGTEPERIEVVWSPTMFFSVQDDGQARYRFMAEDRTFTVSAREYRRIRDLLRVYRDKGLVCDDPSQTPSREGYFL